MFNTLCFWLNVVRLSWLVAVLRVVLHMLFAPVATEARYDDPARVGYQGWIEVPILGVLAFRRLNGALLYRW